MIIGGRAWGDFGLDPAALRERGAELEGSDAGAVLRAFYSLYAERQRKPRWGDKTPAYVRAMRPIAAALPEARFIHLIRDGRDVALSRRRRGMGEGKPMAETANLWRRRIESARADARRLRGRYVELRYEDLVAAPESHLRELCELCELEFDAAMLSHHERAGERLAELGGDLEADGGRQARQRHRAARLARARQTAAERRASRWLARADERRRARRVRAGRR